LFWEKAGIRIKQYEDDPRWPHPKWKSLNPAIEDVVLSVNYFGVRNGKVWQEWRKENPYIILFEDHTHDPFSDWALTSEADYAFASIRKTFPVPDGAILWSPKGHSLPAESRNINWTASALKLAAMILKKEYLMSSNNVATVKDAFRKFQVAGEDMLSESSSLNLSPWSRFLLKQGFPEKWRHKREKNVRQFLDLIGKSENFTSLFSSWPKGHCPFNPVLIFSSEKLRNIYRNHLISQNIYASIHWNIKEAPPSFTLDLSKRILTIPLDQRYDKKDVNRVVSLLMSIKPEY
jgi:hypothetical protein